ncbi:MAG: Crp/Fnr family transcriptional regulator [Actinobacteria bacterium]|nr:Crp/Fnr family transcriptional regulator [Actinomycetota bacterium]
MRVLEFDPDLAPGLAPSSRAEAAAASEAEVIHLAPGVWRPPTEVPPAHMGMLMIEGLLARRVRLAGRESVELLAPGDVLRPWIVLGPTSSIEIAVVWSVLEPAAVAVLDPDFARRLAPWPEVTAALMDRLTLRARWLAFTLAISHVRRVDDRLLLLFWHLADRRGRVTADGVVVPVKLSHQALGTIIGAQRPTVSTALGQLRDRGLLERANEGSWILRGEPPRPASFSADG